MTNTTDTDFSRDKQQNIKRVASHALPYVCVGGQSSIYDKLFCSSIAHVHVAHTRKRQCVKRGHSTSLPSLQIMLAILYRYQLGGEEIWVQYMLAIIILYTYH